MMHRLLGWVLSLAKRWVDDVVVEEELHAFLRTRLQDLTAYQDPGVSPAIASRLTRVFLAAERLRGLGFEGLPQMKAWPVPGEQVSTPVSDFCEPVVHGGKIAKDVVDSFLLSLRIESLMTAEQRRQMERLLRHIEVRRQDALQFDRIFTEDARWAAVNEVSLLCVFYSRQEGDYRFLNAALKLNDWSYRHHRKMGVSLSVPGFLEALLEAEIALMEMIG